MKRSWFKTEIYLHWLFARARMISKISARSDQYLRWHSWTALSLAPRRRGKRDET